MKYLFVIFALIITGCDSVGGIRHYAKLDSAPPLDCVESTLRSVSGVSNVSFNEEDGGRPLTISGIKSPNKIYRFSYSADELQGNFYFSVNYKNEADYTHTYMYINSTPPQEEVDIIFPIIKDIERALFQTCGISEFKGSIDRYCSSGIKCI